jgi:hypothetical protein
VLIWRNFFTFAGISTRFWPRDRSCGNGEIHIPENGVGGAYCFFFKKILLKYLYLSFAACVVLVKTSLFLKNKYLIGNCNVVGHVFCQFVTVSCLTEIITCCLNKEETYFLFKFFSKYCHCYKIYVLLFQLMFILECHLFYDLSFTISLVIIVSPFIEVTFICSFHWNSSVDLIVCM